MMIETISIQKTGIPTATRVNHYGYVVPDVDQAITFFTEVLGFSLLSLDGPVSYPDDRMTRWWNVHPRAAARFAFVQYGRDVIELVEWQTPDQNTHVPSNSDLGGRHFAIGVHNIDAALAYLQAQPGVTVYERSEWGFVYFTTPWGMLLQIVLEP